MYPVASILFLDIETVPQYSSYNEQPEEWKTLWGLKAQYLIRNKEEETVETIYPRAGIYAEFGKIVCISCGFIQGAGTDKKIILKSFAGDEEKKLLYEFSEMLKKWSADGSKFLCAHNGKEFDFPYLCRRMVINQIAIPSILNMSGKKPWEVNHLDTMDLWKFGDFKNYTSLNLLAHSLGIQTPKDDIDGSMVWEVYWKEKNLPRIVTYCQKDVVTVAQIFLRMNGEPLIREENIEIKP
ncbi:MAG: 3'-5' exonuclease [Chitinophagaceae bacterium]|nr:3'-5' exonuclease [Chitinophagaceae bacterium]MBL0307344.1 3'-5' exonuclease [Chitinophagaceae bacterium]HQV61820.1 3'-5' exonuclease [Chitinophagaceae bacterium]HQV87154.1 3'-5' exonuclease [Chitinophagaceae bacterium]HQX72725.1 3'-5' exonuclease [Chitinophagaceae bacterium]